MPWSRGMHVHTGWKFARIRRREWPYCYNLEPCDPGLRTPPFLAPALCPVPSPPSFSLCGAYLYLSDCAPLWEHPGGRRSPAPWRLCSPRVGPGLGQLLSQRLLSDLSEAGLRAVRDCSRHHHFVGSPVRTTPQSLAVHKQALSQPLILSF